MSTCRRFLAALTAMSFAAGCATDTAPTSTENSSFSENPVTWAADDWKIILGGDDLTADTDYNTLYAALSAPAASKLSPTDHADLSLLASEVLAADITGIGRAAFSGYWPDGNGTFNGELLPGTNACTDVTVKSVSPRQVPDTPNFEIVKALVIWSASDCPQPPALQEFDNASVAYVYFKRSGADWSPVRPGPLQPPPVVGAQTIPTWALEEIEGCAGDPVSVRLEVAFAVNQMCADAAAAGVDLSFDVGHRSAEDQQDLFDDAVEQYGSRDLASRFIAVAGPGFCASRHCAGEAIDVIPTEAAVAWLTTPQGCANLAGGVSLDRTTCNADERSVLRYERYGFSAPIPSNRWHLEYSLPLEPFDNTEIASRDCDPALSSSVPETIASVWRCRLAQVGVFGEKADNVVARALVVARCASGWAPSASAFGGAYINTPNAQYGDVYERYGLFQLSPGWFSALAAPGASVFDPARNADIAAQIFTNELAAGRDPWTAFPCAAGNDRVFEASVLPENGGSAIPTWAFDY